MVTIINDWHPPTSIVRNFIVRLLPCLRSIVLTFVPIHACTFVFVTRCHLLFLSILDLGTAMVAQTGLGSSPTVTPCSMPILLTGRLMTV